MKRFLLIILFIASVISGNATPVDSLSHSTFGKDLPVSHKASYHQMSVSKYANVMSRSFDLPTLEALDKDVDFGKTPILLSDTLEAERLRAFEVDHYVKENKRFVETFDETLILDLPVGIKKTIGNLKYTIVVSGFEMKPDGAYLSAYMIFEVPDSDEKLAFGGHKIKFSKKGGLSNGAQLRLLGAHSMNLGPKTLLTLLGNNTFIEWDCNGFKAMGIEADVEFSRDLFVPDSAAINQEKRVKGHFSTVLTDWNDMIAEITLPAFRLKHLDGFVFTVKKAIIDNSTLRALPGMNYPDNYELAAQQGLWKGIYIEEVSLQLPAPFTKKGSKEKTKISLYNAVIDKQGLSAIAEVKRLLDQNEGRMDKWPFSVDAFRLNIVSNTITMAGFEGDIKLPVVKDKPLNYKAVIAANNEYTFSVSGPASEKIKFNFIAGTEVELFPSSYIEVRIKDNKFLPKASLNGQMNIGVSNELTVTSLGFERLNLQTVDPQISIGGFSFSKKSKEKDKLGSFHIGITDIYGTTTKDEMKLSFTAMVALTGDGEGAGSLGGQAGFTIISKMQGEEEETPGLSTETPTAYQAPHWEFDRLEVSKIGIAFDQGAFALKGSLAWFKDDPTYGNGFNGDVAMSVMQGAISVKAVGLFGKINNTHYWFADALAPLPPGMGFGAVEFNAFGGGAFYHVTPSTKSTYGRGMSLSGINYAPDSTAGLGLKATVLLATPQPSESLFNGDATLKFDFNEGGGLREANFKGNGYFLTPMITISMPGLSGMVGNMVSGMANSLMPKAAISAHIDIQYDVANRTLHGNFETFVNVAYGIIKGIGDNNRAGWAVLHASPDDWYIHVGSPDDPIGLQLLGLVKSKSYFMMGDYIPGSPAPPQLVQEVLNTGEDMMTYMDDLNAVGEGQGIAFGSRFGMDTGDKSFLMFYGRFAATAGFDVMLKNYGSTTCVGSNSPIGINGWYANGQAFAAFMGKIGIKVKLFGKKRKLEILKIAAGAILQAKLPNPFWMKGVVGGDFSVMNGLVSGHCKFEVTIGEECELQAGSVLESLAVISQLTPGEAEKTVNVFTAAQGVFNMEVDKVFQMVDLDEERKLFRIKLDEIKIMDGNTPLAGKISWNNLHDVVSYKTSEILPGEKQLKFIVQVSFEENKNDTWIPVVVNGEKVIERKESMFTTGKAPDYLPEENVAYSYPMNGQLHFHPKEYNKGYIHLISGMKALFTPAENWKQTGRIVTSNGEELPFDFTYANNQVDFQLPEGLNTNTIYAIELVNTPLYTSDGIDSNVEEGNVSLTLGNNGSTAQTKTKTATGTIQQYQEKVIFSAVFQTSQYNTFEDKIRAISVNNTWRVPIRPTIHQLKAAITSNETFDTFEINRGTYYEPLVSFSADLDIPWFNNMIKPLAYPAPFPIDGLNITRAEEPYGIPPYKALYIKQDDEGMRLTEDMVNGVVPMSSPGNSTIVYNLPFIMYQDYSELRQQAANTVSYSNGSGWMERIITTPFPGIATGTTYKVEVGYRLPGTDIIRSRGTISFIIN